MKIVIWHAGYGCDTGCCGHWIEVEGHPDPTMNGGRFSFEHPWKETHLEFARQLLIDELGADHTADLDWDNCLISED